MNSFSTLAKSEQSVTHPVHLLVLTPFYPVADNDAQGCFVAEPLSRIEELGITNTVLAVRPFYRGFARANNSTFPAQWSHFLAWPGNIGLSSAGAFLYAGILPKIRRLHKANP